MTPKEYQTMIDASGGLTRAETKRGDRPQPFTREDESALMNAWQKAFHKTTSKSKKHKQRKTA